MIKTELYRAGWLWLLMALHFTGTGQVPRATGNAPNDQVRANLAGTLGTYANPPRFPDKKVDIDRLIEELQDLQMNSYHWLVRETKDDLKVAVKFIRKARRAGINVWITLVPPSESPPITKVGYSEPYRLDFEMWAVNLAKLSLKYHNLVAWSIDDFVHNLKFFTPEYVERFTRMARDINPNLKFVPCCYYRQTTEGFVNQYGSYFDGILFPYRAESAGANLKDPSKVEAEIAHLRKLFRPGFPVVIDIYATRHSRLGDSTPEYVRDVLDAGLKFADGVFIYRHQDPVVHADKYQVVREGIRKFRNE